MTTVTPATAALMAIHHYESGDIRRAAEITQSLLSQRPDNAQGLLAEFCIRARSGDRAGAQALFEKLATTREILAHVPRVVEVRPGPYLGDDVLQSLLGSKHAYRTEFSDHMATLVYEATITNPRLIVELGTQRGESTRALLSVAARAGATLLTIDIGVCDFPVPDDMAGRCHFVQADDVTFGKERFADWCAGQGLAPLIDVLFIDTSHYLEHTRAELDAWMPFLRPGGVAMFHDTNMGQVAVRHDGTLVNSWDNERGVIGPVQEFVGVSFDERHRAVCVTDDWIVTHDPRCNGFTVVRSLHRPTRGDSAA